MQRNASTFAHIYVVCTIDFSGIDICVMEEATRIAKALGRQSFQIVIFLYVFEF